MTTSQPPRLSDMLCFAVHSTAHALHRTYKPLLAPLGLTYPQYLVMMLLWETDGMSVKALGDQLMLDSGTLTPLLKRLEAAGFVTRQRAKADERQVEIFLTDEGRALGQKSCAIPAAIGEAMGISLEEINALHQRLLQVRQELLKRESEA
ncbi:MarR family transcriptional regulator [Acetobacteraceae bacterium H6797]|nr:MarR family transcriptional regulator [Acetobacteraceae bacterium H6797]